MNQVALKASAIHRYIRKNNDHIYLKPILAEVQRLFELSLAAELEWCRADKVSDARTSDAERVAEYRANRDN